MVTKKKLRTHCNIGAGRRRDTKKKKKKKKTSMFNVLIGQNGQIPAVLSPQADTNGHSQRSAT
jgi:hypothetical protein